MYSTRVRSGSSGTASALLGGRFATGAEVGAFAGLSGTWHDWPGPVPHPLTQLRTATLLVWGGPPSTFFTEVSDNVWDAMPPPKHRAIWTQGEHWDYLVGTSPPCRSGPGPCTALGVATGDLVTLFLGKYLPPELAIHLVDEIPDNLAAPELTLTPEQQFFAGGIFRAWQCSRGRTRAIWSNKRIRGLYSRTSAPRKRIRASHLAHGPGSSCRRTAGSSTGARMATPGATSAFLRWPTAEARDADLADYERAGLIARALPDRAAQ